MTPTATRDAELRAILTARRRDMQHDVQGRIRDGRAGQTHEVRDEIEASDGNHQGDIDLTLLQMRTETLVRIDQALARLDAGQYGTCAECDEEISERRLRALPFAVRCQSCEEIRERTNESTRRLAARRGALSLFAENVGH